MIIHSLKYSHKLKLFFRATTIHLKADQTKEILVEDEGRESLSKRSREFTISVHK